MNLDRVLDQSLLNYGELQGRFKKVIKNRSQ